jgi:actin-like ATPase involved in cell morphogenesis
MHPPGTVGVGVDLGSSATTVSTRRCYDREETRHYDRERGEGPDDRLTEAIRSGGQGSASVALTVPAAWKSTRRRAHAEAAANAGFDVAVLVSEPEAAARYLAEAEGAQQEGPLIVCGLGAASCNVGVVRREGDRYRVEAAKSADDLGGRAFDRLLLDHLAARHRAVALEFWKRVADPGETALRARMLAEVKRAREHLTDHPSAAVRLPGTGREVRLSREEAEQCLTPAVLRTMALVEEAIHEASIEEGERAGLVLVGGASRTPLVATVIRHHLGIEPILPDVPELVLAEGAALAALARAEQPAAEEETPPPERLRTSPGVLVTSMVVGLAVAAIVAVALMNRDPNDDLGAETVTDDIGGGSLPIAVEESTSAETDAPGAEPSPTPEAQDEGPEGDAEGTDGPVPSPSPSVPQSDTATTAADVTSGAAVQETAEEVPDVTGESLADAKRILREAGFTNVAGEGSRRTDPDMGHCEATAQNPGGGTRAEPGDLITVSYVFVGTDNC